MTEQRTKELDMSRLENQLSLARNEINNLRQQLRTLNQIHRKECDEIRNKLTKIECGKCERRVEKIDTTSAIASTSLDDKSTLLRYIGIVHTEFPSKRGTPRQPNICNEAVGKLILNNDVFTNPHHALHGLEQFSHMWIIFHFNQTESKHTPAKVAPPRLNGLKMGVFGTRSPHRPSPIGLSLVKINHITDNIIYFKGVDMVDKTPVFDIKPFIPQYDIPNQVDLLCPDLSSNYHYRDDHTRPPSGDGQMTEDESRGIHLLSTEDAMANSIIRTLEGEENERSDVPGAITNETSRYLNSETIRSDSRIGEREAPDGEETDLGIQGAMNSIQLQSSDNVDSVRIPSWVANPVVPALRVQFKMPAEIQLRQLGSEGEEKKRIIRNILSEDPRSVYLRERQGDSPYVFQIADLFVSCSFNDDDKTVFVLHVLKSDGSEKKTIVEDNSN